MQNSSQQATQRFRRLVLPLFATLICQHAAAQTISVTPAVEPGTYNGPGTFSLPNGTTVQIVGEGTLSISASGDISLITYTGSITVNGGPLPLSSASNGSLALTTGPIALSPVNATYGGSLTLTAGGGSGSASSTQGGGAISISSGSVTLGSMSVPAVGSVTLSGTAQSLGWQSFSLSTTDAENFTQPTGSAAVLSRVMGANPGIEGNLSGDGRIWLVDPHGGVLMAKAGQGAIAPAQVAHTVQAAMIGIGSVLSAAGTVPNGAHSRPLQYRAGRGENVAWVAGDLGQDDHKERNGDFSLGEAGVGRNFGAFQLNAALGRTSTRQNMALSGKVTSTGNYLLAEALAPLTEGATAYGQPWLTLGGYFHWGEARVRRGYLNFGIPDSSTGTPDTRARGLRIRLDMQGAASIGGVSLSPYADASRTVLSQDGYTESGGGFPARFDTRNETQTELRLGVNTSASIGNGSQLLGLFETAHRFQRQAPGSSGEILGMFSFDLLGHTLKQDWLRAGIGLETRLGDGIFSTMLNLTTQGSAPNAWLATSYRLSY